MAASTTTYRMWKRLSERPGGSRLFSAAAMVRVPYFASIVPHVVRMEPGFAEVTVPKWFFVYNHLHTVHAIASCNAAEIAMGMLMEATVPTSHRWIPKAMNVQYLQKATTGLRAQARLEPVPDFDGITEGAEIVVPVSVVDSEGTEVVHADITCWITPTY
jgi:acyl-coenzyme A thioesterase PaaI-like protein